MVSGVVVSRVVGLGVWADVERVMAIRMLVVGNVSFMVLSYGPKLIYVPYNCNEMVVMACGEGRHATAGPFCLSGERAVIPLFMFKPLLFLTVFTTLNCLWTDCRAQPPDSTGRKLSISDSAGRKLSIWEKRRRVLEERVRLQRERADDWAKLPLTEADRPNKWSLSFNPFGLLEPQLAFGVGVGYQATNCVQIWLESSALGQFYQKPAQSCIGGVREILALKFYLGPRQSLFLASEFRWRQVYYHDVANFSDPVTMGDMKNYTYTLEDIIFGGAVWFGGRVRITNNHRLRLEPSIGLGFKSRTVVWHGVPAGYGYEHADGDINPFSTSPRVSTPLTFYLPATLRLVYVL